VLHELGCAAPREVVRWLYGRTPPPIREVAALAQHVLRAAAQGDADAMRILDAAAAALADLVHILQRRLTLAVSDVCFAGGLLQQENELSRRLCEQLGLPQVPPTRYPPVVGAALLAQMRWTEANANEGRSS
jgi:N-acetylglucosamine kinase-like BadF-type ATPase